MFKKNYVLLIWGLLLVLAPIYCTYAIMAINPGSDVYRAILDYLHYPVYGFLYSAPGFFAIHFIYLRLRESIKNSYALKGVLIILGLIGMLSAFALIAVFHGSLNAYLQYFFCIYVIVIILLIIAIPIRLKAY